MEAMMSCRFNYVIPRAGLTLTEIGRIFETDWAQECAVEMTQTYYAGRLDTRQRDAHVRAYREWRKEQRRLQQRQKRALETALWRQEQASIREQEEAWNCPSRTKATGTSQPGTVRSTPEGDRTTRENLAGGFKPVQFGRTGPTSIV